LVLKWTGRKISLPHLSPLKTPMKQPVVAAGKALQFLK